LPAQKKKEPINGTNWCKKHIKSQEHTCSFLYFLANFLFFAQMRVHGMER